MKLIVHAPNIHCGGGLSLLRSLLPVLPNETQLILDERFSDPGIRIEQFPVLRVKPTVVHRFLAELHLWKTVKADEHVFCLGNLPPLFCLKGTVSVFLQNRYLIDSLNFSELPAKLCIRLQLERLWLRICKGHADHIIVQTPSMRVLLKKLFSIDAHVLPFVADAKKFNTPSNARQGDQKKYDFVYVASGEPHKNHRTLIHAWQILSEQNIRPHLCLTVNPEKFPQLSSWIERVRVNYDLKIRNVGSVSAENIKVLYDNSNALIYPSLLESFGLPLIEARCSHLAILASELDYVRDVVDPDQSFDPESSVSIARAVKRYMGLEERPAPILDPADFVQRIMKMSKTSCIF
jgi:glycosyltransferase involved in cell wall biosynthesis